MAIEALNVPDLETTKLAGFDAHLDCAGLCTTSGCHTIL